MFYIQMVKYALQFSLGKLGTAAMYLSCNYICTKPQNVSSLLGDNMESLEVLAPFAPLW